MSKRSVIVDKNRSLRQKELVLLAAFTVTGLTIGWMQLSAWRYTVGWDTVSYLEIADQVLKGHPEELFGSYWSPLFPLIIASLKILTNNRADEFFQIALSMFICFAFSLVSFSCFAHALLAVHIKEQEEEEEEEEEEKEVAHKAKACSVVVSPGQLLFAMYSIFLFCTLGISELSHKTPDVLASGICFLALWQWLITLNGRATVGRCAFIGFLVGLSYWAKNFNLGWGPVFILSLIFLGGKNSFRGKQLSALILTYVVTMATLAIPISLKAGRPTFSDVVRVGCAWSETVGYMGIVHGRGESFVHPTRIFFSNPSFYEFASPFRDVTYPPFYAPQYWYDGVKFKLNIESYGQKLWQKFILFGNSLGFYLALIIAILSFRNKSWPLLKNRLILFAPGIAPSIFGLVVLFFMLDPEGRYYASSLAPVLCFLCASLGLPADQKDKNSLKLSLTALIAWLVLLVAIKSWFHFYYAFPSYANWLRQTTKVPFPASPAYSQHLANMQALTQAGLKPGDLIARITRCGDGEFYWAKGAKLKIVCETPDVDGFWKSSKEQRQVLYTKLRAFGVKAIVQDWCPPSKNSYPVPSDPGWYQVPHTQTYILIL